MRPAEADDRPAIGLIADATGLFPSSLLDEMIAGYLGGSKPDIWLVARWADEPVAFAFCEAERMTEGTWSLLAIAVSPGHQRRSVGTAMIRHLEERLAREGARILLVETMGVPEFEGTRAFYRRCGFTEEARIREFYAPRADKIVFWKALATA